MMACVVELRVHIAWWLKLYLWSIAGFAQMTGMDPDMRKVGRMVHLGVKVKPHG